MKRTSEGAHNAKQLAVKNEIAQGKAAKERLNKKIWDVLKYFATFLSALEENSSEQGKTRRMSR